jgi:hypothetical protein
LGYFIRRFAHRHAFPFNDQVGIVPTRDALVRDNFVDVDNYRSASFVIVEFDEIEQCPSLFGSFISSVLADHRGLPLMRGA